MKIIKICVIPGCSSKQHAKSFCRKHYEDNYEKGYREERKLQAKTRRIGPNANIVREQSRLSKRKFLIKNKDNEEWLTKQRDNRLKVTYGLDLNQYNSIFTEQRACCAICEMPQSLLKKALGVDHDHKCCSNRKACKNCVRGLLCPRCNDGIARFNDSPLLLEKAIAYLNKYKKEEIADGTRMEIKRYKT